MTEQFEYKKCLYCWWPRPAFTNWVNAECTDEEKKRLSEILDSWSNARKKFSDIIRSDSGSGKTINISDISKEYSKKIKEILDEPTFKSTFNQMPIEFKVVEIDKLVSLQDSVRLGYIKKLIESFPAKPTFDELIDICLSVNKSTSEVSELVLGNTVTYTSDNADLRFLGMMPWTVARPELVRQNLGGVLATSTLLVLGFGASPVNVLNVNGRMVLNNGFHRVYALRQMGVTHIPVIVQKVINPSLDIPSIYGRNLKEYMFNAERLPLIKEYFDDELTITLKTKIKRKAIKITLHVDEFTVPM